MRDDRKAKIDRPPETPTGPQGANAKHEIQTCDRWSLTKTASDKYRRTGTHLLGYAKPTQLKASTWVELRKTASEGKNVHPHSYLGLECHKRRVKTNYSKLKVGDFFPIFVKLCLLCRLTGHASRGRVKRGEK